MKDRLYPVEGIRVGKVEAGCMSKCVWKCSRAMEFVTSPLEANIVEVGYFTDI
jgi:hypothetical protein